MLLAYQDYGPGPVVVLLHGFPLNRSMWSEQVAKIGALYRVITPDLRGHGDSAAPDGVYTMDDMADDVVELLDALQLREPVAVAGLSMGGYVALSLVTRYPERVKTLMLLDTRAVADSVEAAANRDVLASKAESTQSPEPVIAAMLPKLLSEASREGHAERVAEVRTMIERTPIRTLAGALRGMAVRPDRVPQLGKINVPTLVLVGADDTISTPAEMRQIADGLPNAEYVVIPDAGHLAPMENPAATNNAILDFLARHP